MRRSRSSVTRSVAFSVLLSALAASGCERNSASSFLVPSGVRPAPAVPTASIFGFLSWSATSFPDLGTPPYPPTVVEARNSAGAVAGRDTLAAGSLRFEIGPLLPGTYSVIARSRTFLPAAIGGIRVVDSARDAGDLQFVSLQSDSISTTMNVVGTMPGFGVAELEPVLLGLASSTSLFSSAVGAWYYPNDDFPGVTVTAGTHRLKFVTDPSSSAGNLIGWGGDSTQVIDVPIQNARMRFTSGAAQDLKLRFPATGIYQFLVDERRQTFSIVAVPPLARHGTTRR